MKFEDIKKIAAWDILKLLQKMTKENAELLKENSEYIKVILKGKGQIESVRNVQVQNNELLKQNSDNLKLHNNLLTFLKSLQNFEENEIVEEINQHEESIVTEESQKTLTFDEYFQNTVDGSFVYDSTHPYYCSDDFRERLTEFYLRTENYEKCALLAERVCK